MTPETIDWDAERRELEDYIQTLAEVRSSCSSQVDEILSLATAARTDDAAHQQLSDGIKALVGLTANFANTLIEVLPLWFDRHKALCGLENSTRTLEPAVKTAITKANEELEAAIPVKTVRYRHIAGKLGVPNSQVRYVIEGTRKTKKK